MTVHGLQCVAAAAIGFSLALTLSASQEPPQERPRFRAGANLVRVDAYITADGKPVTDLTANDFEILEDGKPQKVESFQLIKPRGPAAQTARVEPNSVAESRVMAADPEARVFVLFMDVWHVQLEGSYHAQGPITRLLERVIGQDDLVGVMTPEMRAQDVALARRTLTIERILRDNWYWGQRDRNQLAIMDPRDDDLRACYPDFDDTKGMAEAIIKRRHEKKTLDALDDLIVHLETVREERKFVVLLTEGWLLYVPNQQLARPLKNPDGSTGPAPGLPGGIGVDPSKGKLAIGANSNQGDFLGCERDRALAAMLDNAAQFDQLLQRANRANVSFYPVDTRGLVVFDTPIGPAPPPPPSVDFARLKAKHEGLRTLALQTDGYAVVDTGFIDQALDRMVADTNVYYLLGYYSTNTKLDGRFRRLTVRVKRPGAQVRARPGYRAPTEAEAAAGSAAASRAPGAGPPSEIKRALEKLAPSRADLPLRIQAAGSAGHIWITAELDPVTMKDREWQQGGRAKVVLQREGGTGPPLVREVTLDAGQRAFSLVQPEDGTLPEGRYAIGLSLFPKGGTLPMQATGDAVIPPKTALVGSSAVASRRGPATGLQYHATADSRFKRTERIRLQVPRVVLDAVASARLLDRTGQPTVLAVTVSEGRDETRQTPIIVADLTLAPLAQGEYVLEVAVEKNGRKESVAYAFRIVP